MRLFIVINTTVVCHGSVHLYIYIACYDTTVMILQIMFGIPFYILCILHSLFAEKGIIIYQTKMGD